MLTCKKICKEDIFAHQIGKHLHVFLFLFFLNELQVVRLITACVQVKACLAQSEMSGPTQTFV